MLQRCLRREFGAVFRTCTRGKCVETEQELTNLAVLNRSGRQRDLEVRPSIRPISGGNRAVMAHDDLLYDRQAESRSARSRRKKRLKQFGQGLRRDARAVVADR